MNNMIDLLASDKTKPHELRKVAALIRLALLISIPNMAVGLVVSERVRSIWQQNFGLMIASMVFGLALSYFISVKILDARRWAKIFYLVQSGSLILSLGVQAQAFSDNFLFGLIQSSQFGLQFYAAYLLILDPTTKSCFDSSTSITTAKAVEPVGEIAKIHELFKSGALTQEEFDAEKQKILKKAA